MNCNCNNIALTDGLQYYNPDEWVNEKDQKIIIKNLVDNLIDSLEDLNYEYNKQWKKDVLIFFTKIFKKYGYLNTEYIKTLEL